MPSEIGFMSFNCSSQAEICVNLLVSNALPGINKLKSFLVQPYYDIHCSDEVWERIKDVIPKYDEITISEVSITRNQSMPALQLVNFRMS